MERPGQPGRPTSGLLVENKPLLSPVFITMVKCSSKMIWDIWWKVGICTLKARTEVGVCCVDNRGICIFLVMAEM